jgi:hypothetical protein
LIAIGRIGNVPQWADRWSALGSAGSGHSPGDLVSFKRHSSPGGFTQQLSIVVDQVTSSGATTGIISKWHFLAGGQYSTLPAWSGWSVTDRNRARLW